MGDSDAVVDPPRIERLTRWALALDVAAVVLVAGLAGNAAAELYFPPDEDIFIIFFFSGAPMMTITALVVAVLSTRRASRRSARFWAWSMVLVSAVLVLGWFWVWHELASHDAAHYVSLGGVLATRNV